MPGSTATTILVVDDEPLIGELLAVNLQHRGMTALWVEDGCGAQRALERLRPDLILLDWMLPGASGVSLVRRWRASPRTGAIPVLMMSARGEHGDVAEALAAGADDYIGKPFSVQELLSRVERLLGRRATASPGRHAPVMQLRCNGAAE